MTRRSAAVLLFLILAIAVLTQWIPRPWINPTLFHACLFLLASACAIRLVARPCELHLSFPMIPLAAAVAWGLLQPTVSAADTRVATLTWLANLVAFTLASQLCQSDKMRRQFLDGLLDFAFVISIVSVVTQGPFVNRDQYAAFIELTLPLALVQSFRAWGFAVISAWMYASVIAGASRAGALLVTAEIVIIPLALWMKRRLPVGRERVAAVHVWLLAVVFGAVVGWAALWGRFQDPDPMQGRREILAGTIAMVHARPWTGFGLGTFRAVYPAFATLDFRSVVQHAHNDWAEWAADGGIPFFLLLLSIALWSIPRAARTLWGIGILAVFVHGLVDFPLQKPALELWLFTLLGAMVVGQDSSCQAGINRPIASRN